MQKSKIQWTDCTWNPIIGCHKISPGCDHCYAERMANRIAHMDTWIGEQYREVVGLDGKWNGNTHVADSHMDFPRTLKKPRKIFIGSMTDIFLHSQSKQGRLDVARLFGVMACNPKHTFQILTKRPVEMKIFMDEAKDAIISPVFQQTKNIFLKWPIPNVWLGVTVCNQEEANFKIPILLDTPAAVRFVSIEPMLGKIDLEFMPHPHDVGITNALKGIITSTSLISGESTRISNKLDWVIVGGETGPGARLLKEEWVHDLWKQSIGHHIPFFFKSWGKLKTQNRVIESFKEFPK